MLETIIIILIIIIIIIIVLVIILLIIQICRLGQKVYSLLENCQITSQILSFNNNDHFICNKEENLYNKLNKYKN